MRVQRFEPRSIAVAPEELALLLEALDSHEYWALGDVLPRNDGMVWIPGDSVGPVDRYWEDEEPTTEQVHAIEAVRECGRLAERLHSAMTAT